MCEICHRRRCAPACPSRRSRVIGRCAACREAIYDHEPALRDEGDGQLYHAECLESRSPAALLSLFGITLTEVEE